MNVRVEQSPAPLKTANVTLMPFTSQPSSYLEQDFYRGNFSVNFVCYNPGKANAKISIQMKIENGGNVDFSLFFTKNCCEYVMKDEFIYIVYI